MRSKITPLHWVAAGSVAVVAALGVLLMRPMCDAAPQLPASDPARFAKADTPPAPAPAPAPAASPATAVQPAPTDDGFVIKHILPISGPIKYGEWHWDEQGAPAGPLVITVDLDARVLSVFRGGHEIGATAVLLGFGKTPTPTGVFPVKWKDAVHFSSTYDNAPMPYTMNLTADGVAIHGTKVEKGYASHGCVGVPNSFAKKIFRVTPVGTKVYITRGKTAKAGDSLI